MPESNHNSAEIVVADFESASVQIDPAAEKDVRLKRIARYRTLWTQKRFLVRVAAIGLVLSTVLAFASPNQYESTTRLMPPDDSSPSMALIAAAARSGLSPGGLASSLLGLRSSGVLFIGIVESRTVQDDLITKFDLRKLYKHKKWIDTRKELASRTEAVQDHRNGIISITVTDKDPQRAAAMAQEYVDELNRVVAQLSTSSARRERLFLEGRLAEVNQELETAEKNFSDFASKNTAIDIKEQGRAMIDAAAALEGQMIASETELEGLRQIYADGHVRVRETQARVNELQRQLQKLGGSSDAGADAKSAPDSIYPSIKKLPLLGVAYADLYRDMKVKEAIFEILTQQYELAKVEEVKEIPTVRVLDAPELPERKSFPHRLWMMLGGTVLSSLLAIAWIFGNERWNQFDSHDPGKVLAVEVLHAVQAKLPNRFSNGNGNGLHLKGNHSAVDGNSNGAKQ
jgi:uncharacterized protein involved in exopolysaccharide biosynthesis